MGPDPVELYVGAAEVVVGATDVQFPQCARDLIEGRAGFPGPTLTRAGKPMQKPVVRLQVGAGQFCWALDICPWAVWASKCEGAEMIAWSVGWQEILVCFAIIAIPAIIAGGVCLAVGLAQKKKPLSITGVALLAGPLLVFVLLLAVLLFMSAGAIR